jgi:hypothetical protein
LIDEIIVTNLIAYTKPCIQDFIEPRKMSKKIKSEIVFTKFISANAQQDLTDLLYSVNCQIFDGVDRTDFENDVVCPKSQDTAISIYKNSEGSVVGYCAIHYFEKMLNEIKCGVIRVESGLRKEYRRRNTNAPFIIRQILKYVLSNPRRPMYFLGELVHPSSYAVLTKYCNDVCPSIRHHAKGEMSEFFREVSSSFGLVPVNPNKPEVVHVGWQTRDTEKDKDYWGTCSNQAARFFVEQNPDYRLGHGLLTLAPITARGVVRAMGLLLNDRLLRIVPRLSIRPKRTRLLANDSLSDSSSIESRRSRR